MTLEQDIRRLATVPLLAELEVEALRLIAFSGETREFRPDDILFRQGDPSDGGFLLLIGSVLVESTGRKGSAQIVEPGGLIGERALMSAIPRPATATVREPSTLFKISRRLFYRVMTEFPGSAHRVRRRLARDVHERLTAAVG